MSIKIGACWQNGKRRVWRYNTTEEMGDFADFRGTLNSEKNARKRRTYFL